MRVCMGVSAGPKRRMGPRGGPPARRSPQPGRMMGTPLPPGARCGSQCITLPVVPPVRSARAYSRTEQQTTVTGMKNCSPSTISRSNICGSNSSSRQRARVAAGRTGTLAGRQTGWHCHFTACIWLHAATSAPGLAHAMAVAASSRGGGGATPGAGAHARAAAPCAEPGRQAGTH